jgi:hypothetical protein
MNPTELSGTVFVGKIEEKYFAFYIIPVEGGVAFSKASPPFHTLEEAHLFLLEKAKKESTTTVRFSVVEILKSYIIAGEHIPSE